MSSQSKRKIIKNKHGELPEGWSVRKSISRDRNYYFNEYTGVSTWTKPKEGVTDDRTSMFKAQCSKTGEPQVIIAHKGSKVPSSSSLTLSPKQGISCNKIEKSLMLSKVENAAKKVSFTFKQKPSLQKPNSAFSSIPSTSKKNDRNVDKTDRNCHRVISGNVTKGFKHSRRTKSLESNVFECSDLKQESSKDIKKSTGCTSKVLKNDEKLVTYSPISSQHANENSKCEQPQKRYSLPTTELENSHVLCSKSSINKFTQEELLRRYDITHPVKVIKPIKEEDTLVRKRVKEERILNLNDSTVGIPLQEKDVIDMEWENIENEKVLLNIQEHRQQFLETNREDFNSPPVDMEVQYFDFSDSSSKDSVIVLDTNVLISDVKFVEKLIENEFKGIGYLTFVIPWMVLKELDALKGKTVYQNSALERNSRRAIQFINQCFNSHNPWVKGQSAVDDRQECIKVDSPDDSILNCCLQLQNRNNKVILLSNDINLCNKAIANGVSSFGKEQLEKKIQSENFGMLFVADNRLGNGNQESTPEKSCLLTTKNEQVQSKGFILLTDLKNLLHQFLSKLLETEMKSVYEEMWIKIVYLKPPWSLLDLLLCFSKHWCAVFCFIMEKSAKNVIEGLITFFRKRFSGQSKSTIKDVEDVIKSAINLCQSINSKKYCEFALEYTKRFQALLEEDCNVGNTAKSQDSVPSSSDITPNNLGATTVYEAFQKALSLVINFCGVLCDAVRIPFGDIYEKPLRPISWEEIKERLPTVFKCLEDLIYSMKRVLELPESYLSIQHPALISLHSSLLTVISSDSEDVYGITHENLHSFVVEADTRVMLTNGLSQFINYQLLLTKVINEYMNR